jgi:hypothetical protein
VRTTAAFVLSIPAVVEETALRGGWEAEIGHRQRESGQSRAELEHAVLGLREDPGEDRKRENRDGGPDDAADGIGQRLARERRVAFSPASRLGSGSAGMAGAPPAIVTA